MKYSMRRIILPLLLTTVLMLSACGKSSSTPAQSMPEDPPVQAEPAEPEAQPPRALSAEELRTFTELFGTPEYNGFLEKPFLRPSEIEWDAVLRNGAGITEASRRGGNRGLSCGNGSKGPVRRSVCSQKERPFRFCPAAYRLRSASGRGAGVLGLPQFPGFLLPSALGQ